MGGRRKKGEKRRKREGKKDEGEVGGKEGGMECENSQHRPFSVRIENNIRSCLCPLEMPFPICVRYVNLLV